MVIGVGRFGVVTEANALSNARDLSWTFEKRVKPGA